MLRISKAAKIRGGEEVDESVKKPWLPAEDQLLCDLVAQHGVKNWSAVSHAFKDRTGKHCRERWYNHLNPEIKKGNWTQDDDRIIMTMHKEFGNQWAKITKCLPGRTDNAVKNRYNAILRAIKKKNRHGLSTSTDQHSDVSGGEETADSDCTDDRGGQGSGDVMSLTRVKSKHEPQQENALKQPVIASASQLPLVADKLDCYSSSSKSSNEKPEGSAIMSHNSAFPVDVSGFPAGVSAHATAAAPLQHATPRSTRENRGKASNDMETNSDNGDGGNCDGTPRNSIGSWDSGVHDPLFDLDFDSIAEWDFIQDPNPYAYGGGGGGGLSVCVGRGNGGRVHVKHWELRPERHVIKLRWSGC